MSATDDDIYLHCDFHLDLHFLEISVYAIAPLPKPISNEGIGPDPITCEHAHPAHTHGTLVSTKTPYNLKSSHSHHLSILPRPAVRLRPEPSLHYQPNNSHPYFSSIIPWSSSDTLDMRRIMEWPNVVGLVGGSWVSDNVLRCKVWFMVRTFWFWRCR